LYYWLGSFGGVGELYEKFAQKLTKNFLDQYLDKNYSKFDQT